MGVFVFVCAQLWTVLWYFGAFAFVVAVTWFKRARAVRWILLVALVLEGWVELRINHSANEWQYRHANGAQEAAHFYQVSGGAERKRERQRRD